MIETKLNNREKELKKKKLKGSGACGTLKGLTFMPLKSQRGEKNCSTEKVFDDSTNLAEDINLQIQKDKQGLHKSAERNQFQGKP